MIAILIFILSGIFVRNNTRKFFIISILFIVIESLSFRDFGFPRRFIFIYPLILTCSCLLILEMMKKGKWYKITFLLIPIFILLQIKEDLKIISGIKSGMHYEIMSYEIQKKIANKLERIGGKKKVVNLSCVIDIPLLTYGKFEQEDWSYLFAFIKDEVLNKFAEGMTADKGKKLVVTCLIPFEKAKSSLEKKGLRVVKIRDFFGEIGKPIATLFYVE